MSGHTKVGAANSSVQDSAQALSMAIRGISRTLALLSDTPEEAERLAHLERAGAERPDAPGAVSHKRGRRN